MLCLRKDLQGKVEEVGVGKELKWGGGGMGVRLDLNTLYTCINNNII